MVNKKTLAVILASCIGTSSLVGAEEASVRLKVRQSQINEFGASKLSYSLPENKDVNQPKKNYSEQISYNSAMKQETGLKQPDYIITRINRRVIMYYPPKNN